MLIIPMHQLSSMQLKKAQDLLRLREMDAALSDIPELAGKFTAAQITGLQAAIAAATDTVKAKISSGGPAGAPSQRILIEGDPARTQAIIYTQNVEVVLVSNVQARIAELDAEMATITIPTGTEIVAEVNALIDAGGTPTSLLELVQQRLNEREKGQSSLGGLQATHDGLQDLLGSIVALVR